MLSGGVAAAVAVDGGFSLVRGSWRLFIILVSTFSGDSCSGGAATSWAKAAARVNFAQVCWQGWVTGLKVRNWRAWMWSAGVRPVCEAWEVVALELVFEPARPGVGGFCQLPTNRSAIRAATIAAGQPRVM